MAAYTQGLMDLGATVCLRSRPACEKCPVQSLCRGHALGEPTRFPVKTRTLKRRHESWWLQLVVTADEGGERKVWLERRPEKGIWAGLFCPPVFFDEPAALAGRHVEEVKHLTPVAHSLTHRELRLHPILMDVASMSDWTGADNGQWVAWDALSAWGLPAPVRSLLTDLAPDAASR